MKLYGLELEYEDELGEIHHELRGLFKTYEELKWHYEFHISDADKQNYVGYAVSIWVVN